MDYQIINLKNGLEESMTKSEFDKFMKDKDIRNFYTFITDEKKTVYKNDDWLLIPAK